MNVCDMVVADFMGDPSVPLSNCTFLFQQSNILHKGIFTIILPKNVKGKMPFHVDE